MDSRLAAIGLSPFFIQQLTEQEAGSGNIARVFEVHRSGIVANNASDEWHMPLGGSWFNYAPEDRPTVGDWIIHDERREHILRLLDRKSVFKRITAGQHIELQLIAANIDTLFIVTSCNDEFNESRLERYLALALEAGVYPVIVLTKSDLSDEPDSFIARARSIQTDVMVELVNALDKDSLEGLQAWITPGSTIALAGSSGVGKSTLVNTFSGKQVTKVGGIRDQDAKGRHTTSSRSLHRLPNGGLLLDVPGMRELGISDTDASLDELFDEIDVYARKCKFRDCSHNQEPGCAVQDAIESGKLDRRRLENYRKLIQEDERHTATLAERRSRDREFGKMVKQHVDQRKQEKGF